jgi:hypothetical protein
MFVHAHELGEEGLNVEDGLGSGLPVQMKQTKKKKRECDNNRHGQEG